MSGAQRPHICLLLGPKKSGKTSILNVVLDDIEPNSTLYNEPTRVPLVKSFNAFLDFETWDLPGGRYDVEHLDNLDIQAVGSCIFVIDAQAFQGDNTDQARKMAGAIFRINELNPKTTFEIFIHKVDGMSDTYRADVQQDLRNRVMDELNDLADMDGFAASNDYVFPAISYHFTSIYQSSIYEALSKVLSRLMPCQGALERLLDILSTQSSFDKAYIFDLASKLYFATDSTPGDSATLEICNEYIDLHWDFDQIYSAEGERSGHQSQSQSDVSLPQTTAQNGGKAQPSTPRKSAGERSGPKKRSVRPHFSGSVALSNGISICHWELADDIALIARVATRVVSQSRVVVESNIEHFRDAVVQIRELEASR